jgi:hypothetical protein
MTEADQNILIALAVIFGGGWLVGMFALLPWNFHSSGLLRAMRTFQSIRRPFGGFFPEPQPAAPDPMIASMREERRADAARLNVLFGFLLRRLERIMHTLEDTLALVTAERTDIDSLAALTAGIKKQLDDVLAGALTPSQQMRVDAIFDKIQQNKQAVADAVKASDNIGDSMTRTTVTSSNTRSNVGDPVTFTAGVEKHPDAPADKNPTGSMVFTIDGTQVGSTSVGADGTAQSAPISNLTEGDHAVTATYSGDSVFETSTSEALTQTVVAVAPQT